MKNVLLCMAALIISGCGVDVNTIEAQTTPSNDRVAINRAEALVAQRMRDPEATRFLDEKKAFTTSNGDYIVCGTVNAKNAMGGYVGYKPYYVRIRNGSVASLILPSESDQTGIDLKTVIQACSDADTGKILVSS